MRLLIAMALSILAIPIFSNSVYAQETNSSKFTAVSEIPNKDLLAYAILHLKQAIVQLQNSNSTGLQEELTIVTEQATAVLGR